MKIVQLNQSVMFTEVVLRKSSGSYGSQNNSPMKSMTYIRKLVTEVLPISRKGKCRETLLQVASLSLGIRSGVLPA